MSKTKILWFTGLSGSGKSTIAELLGDYLDKKGISYKKFDGDDVRKELHKHLGFSREDIIENNRLIVELCKIHRGEFDFIIVPVISPFKISRDNARKIFGEDFIEIYVKCSYDECKKRDVKGLYKKAELGEINNFIGLHHKYEEPDKPEIILDTVNSTSKECVEKLISFLKI